MAAKEIQSIILVGGGPSSRLFFSRLDNIPNSVPVFATGPSFRIYRTMTFIPKYWALMDSKVVLSLEVEVSKAMAANELADNIFIPSEAVEKSKLLRSAIRRTSSEVYLFNHSQTGTFALNRCIEISPQRIYLIGLEGQYVEKIPSSSRASISKRLRVRGLPYLRGIRQINEFPIFNQNYWNDNYQQPNDLYSLPRSSGHRNSLQEQIDAAMQMGIEVLNLSPISTLTAPFYLMRDFFQLEADS